MADRTRASSPQLRARIAGALYLVTILAGASSLVLGSGRLAASLIATACYVAVTLLFYGIFRPVNQDRSLLAAVFSLVGCALGALTPFHLAPLGLSPLVFFGLYCLLIGSLIWRSTFLPRILGALMAVGGLGWLTFLSPWLSGRLFPYNVVPGVIGEGALTLWLLMKGVDVRQWKESPRRV